MVIFFTNTCSFNFCESFFAAPCVIPMLFKFSTVNLVTYRRRRGKIINDTCTYNEIVSKEESVCTMYVQL